MRATFDIPDELYRQIAAKTASGTKNSVPAWFGMFKDQARQVRDHDMDSIRESFARGITKEREL